MKSTRALIAVLVALSAAGTVSAVGLRRRGMNAGLGPKTGLTEEQVDGIRSILNRTATESWEKGAHAEALTEFLYPDLSPFAFPSSSHFASPSPSANPFPALVCNLAGNVLSAQPWGQWQLIQDGSSADPASVGPAVLLANWTMGEGAWATIGGRNRSGTGGAAQAQVWALLEKTPRASDGAISHRVDSVELWSDFVYMAPPFFAYYGLLANNDSLISLAHEQIRLYRANLQDPRTKLWRHIYVPGGSDSHSDPGLWATGNAWVAGGILRVLATIENSGDSTLTSQFSSAASDLAAWAKEVVDAVWTMPRSGGLLHNYLNESSTFAECSSTALMVANTYRLALVSNLYSSLSSSAPAGTSLRDAESSYQALTRNNQHISKNGTLAPVTDPMSFSSELARGQVSPEGEAFVLLMEAARRDYLADGGQIDSSGGNPGEGSGGGGGGSGGSGGSSGAGGRFASGPGLWAATLVSLAVTIGATL